MPLAPHRRAQVAYPAVLTGVSSDTLLDFLDALAGDDFVGQQLKLTFQFEFSTATLQNTSTTDQARTELVALDPSEELQQFTASFVDTTVAPNRGFNLRINFGSGLASFTITQAETAEAQHLLKRFEEVIPRRDSAPGSQSARFGALNAQFEEVLAATAGSSQLATKLSGHVLQAQQLEAEISAAAEGSTSRAEEVAGLATGAVKAAAEVDSLLDRVRQAVGEVETRRATLEAFVEQVQDHTRRMEDSQTQARASRETQDAALKELRAAHEVATEKQIADGSSRLDAALETATVETEAIVERNSTLQKRIDELLQEANAGSLFHAFERRKEELQKSGGWLAGIVMTTGLFVALTLWFVYGWAGSEGGNAVLWLRLVAAVPLLLLDGFLIQQFNWKRRLAEQYAFKSAVSLSLAAYQRLLSEQDDDDVAGFVRSAIEIIYTAPVVSEGGRQQILSELIGAMDTVASKGSSGAIKQAKKLLGS
jgi:hypothetical protein